VGRELKRNAKEKSKEGKKFTRDPPLSMYANKTCALSAPIKLVLDAAAASLVRSGLHAVTLFGDPYPLLPAKKERPILFRDRIGARFP